MKCPHEEFRIQANISRCTRSEEDSAVVAYYCDLTVWCTICDRPFEFIGLPVGLSPGQPMCSIDGREARMPIKPVGEEMPLDVHGFGVKFHEA